MPKIENLISLVVVDILRFKQKNLTTFYNLIFKIFMMHQIKPESGSEISLARAARAVVRRAQEAHDDVHHRRARARRGAAAD